MVIQSKNDQTFLQAGLPEGFPLSPIMVVVGHYGVGKTNFSLNLALDVAAVGKQVTLIDLDVVNPYFRSSEYGARLAEAGVTLIAPVFAGTTLDVPSLSGGIYPALSAADEDHIVVIDAGGDDVGATALGRFAEQISSHAYAMFYVVNAYRNLTQLASEAVEVLHEIEAKSGLQATGVVNNSHLQGETSPALVLDALPFAKETAALLGLPLVCTTVPAALTEELQTFLGSSPEKDLRLGAEVPDGAPQGTEPKSSALLAVLRSQTLYSVQVYVGTPWE